MKAGAASTGLVATSGRPRFVCLPSRDAAFADYVRIVAASDGPASPGDLEVRIRRAYPSARVRQRELTGEVADQWYVFRESPYTFSLADEWWQPTDVARVVITFGGVAVEANGALLRLLDVERDALIGHHYRGFIPPDSLADVATILSIVLRRGGGASRVVLQRSDGRRIEVDWHAKVHLTRLEAWFRPVTH